ncbi:MAG: 2TM domain-containing protein [Flavobacteriaceae bacterium]
MENYKEDKLKRAKKRVDELKGFYIHLAVYLAVNAFIMVNIAMRSYNDSDSFWEFGTFVTPVFWGIGLLFHASHTFQINPFLGKDWEKKQIQKYMDEDKNEANKYR